MTPPRLGPRGEGWVLGQGILFVLIAAAGVNAIQARTGWNDPDVVAAVVGGFTVAAGIVVAVRGVLDLGPNLTPLPRPADRSSLVESGVYRHIRHPIYAGLVLAAFGWAVVALSAVTTVLALALFVWFDLKSRREELWLVERYPGYADYRRRTRRFVPLLY